MTHETHRGGRRPDRPQPLTVRKARRGRLTTRLPRDGFETLLDRDADVQDFTADLERQQGHPDWQRRWVN